MAPTVADGGSIWSDTSSDVHIIEPPGERSDDLPINIVDTRAVELHRLAMQRCDRLIFVGVVHN